jgi:hypothetical protein
MSYSKLNGIDAAAIASVNGIPKGSIASVNGATTPVTSADNLWIVVASDGGYGHATASAGDPIDAWTGYRDPDTVTDYVQIAYGEDGTANPRWVSTSTSGNRELRWSDDPETDGTWTDINISSGRIYSLMWGNNKWMGVGQMSVTQTVLTSSDGATFGTLDVSSLPDIDTQDAEGIGTDGVNNWIFAQRDRLYASNNNGLSWYLLKDFADSRRCTAIHYSNSRWFVWCTATATGEVVSYADAASSGSWTDTADTNLGGTAVGPHMAACVSTASAGLSTVIAVNSNDIWRSTDSCATGARFLNVLPYGSANSIAGDGAGNWVVVHNAGNISYSVDDGTTWSSGANGLVFDSGTENINHLAVNKSFPL